jgi:hypothetical protein
MAAGPSGLAPFAESDWKIKWAAPAVGDGHAQRVAEQLGSHVIGQCQPTPPTVGEVDDRGEVRQRSR